MVLFALKLVDNDQRENGSADDQRDRDSRIHDPLSFPAFVELLLRNHRPRPDQDWRRKSDICNIAFDVPPLILDLV